MSTSLLLVLFVVVWLFVLAPLVVSDREPIRRTSDALGKTRLLHRGGDEVTRSRRKPTFSQRDVRRAREDNQDDVELVDAELVDNAADDGAKETNAQPSAPESDHATDSQELVLIDDTDESASTASLEVARRRLARTFGRKNDADEELDLGDDAPVTGEIVAITDDEAEAEAAEGNQAASADASSAEESSEADLEAATASDQEDTEQEDSNQEDTEQAGRQNVTSLNRASQTRADQSRDEVTRTVEEDPRLVLEDAMGMGIVEDDEADEDDVAEPESQSEELAEDTEPQSRDHFVQEELTEDDLTEEDLAFAERRRGRGGFDPEAAQRYAATRYDRRRRSVMILVMAVVIATAVGFFFGGWTWWLPLAGVAILTVYLVTLRRTVIAERELNARRIQRIKMARLGVRNYEDDELGVPQRLRRPGAVVVELDDEAADFADLPFASAADFGLEPEELELETAEPADHHLRSVRPSRDHGDRFAG